LASLNGRLDTLGLHRTEQSNKLYSNVTEKLYGEGSCKDSIRKRPRKKFITQKLVLALIDVAKENGDIEWIQRYWNTWHCQNELTTHNGRGYGYFCKNRYCLVCVSIRKADMINRYLPIINTWSQPHFLTLTVKSQKRWNLVKWMEGMKKAMTLILDRCRKRHQRGKGPKLIGMYSLECNFNPIDKWYNPHFHILTENREIANIIKREWCELWNRGPKVMALPYLQTIRKVKETEKDIIETIKYGAKIFTDPEMKKKKGNTKKKDHKIYAAGLHEIYKAMDGRHLFRKFGFKLSQSGNKAPKEEYATDYQKWVYDPKLADYVNSETGQIMTNYIPNGELDLIINNIDTDLN